MKFYLCAIVQFSEGACLGYRTKDGRCVSLRNIHQAEAFTNYRYNSLPPAPSGFFYVYQ